MAYLVTGFLVLILVACFAMLGSEGLWSNAISLFNVVTAGLLAMNFFEPLASYLNSQVPRGTFAWDFTALWACFALSYLVLRTASDFTSRVRVKFNKLVEQIGGYVLALAVGWVVMCFTAMTLHTAPLAREFAGGGFRAEEKMLGGTAPDRAWLAFAKKASRASFAQGDGSATTFNADDSFIAKFATRRETFEKVDSLLLKSGP